MSEYDEISFPRDEIDRIQQEIDRDLKESTPVIGTEPLVTQSTDGEIPSAFPGTLTSTTSMVSPEGAAAVASTILPEGTTSATSTILPEGAAAATSSTVLPEETASASSTGAPYETFVGREAFYQETIKNESINNSKSRFKRIAAIVAIVSILGGTFGGLGYSMGPSLYEKYIAKSPENALPETEAVFTFSKENSEGNAEQPENNTKKAADNIQSQGLPNFVDVVKSIEPAVVNITTKTVNSNNFFDMQIEQPSAATGIIFNKNDELVYIVTNAHVVNGANSVVVSVEGGDPVAASPIGVDSQADLAVISVKMSELKTSGIDDVQVANFGDSDQMEVGEWVLAIGNALGEGNTATAGIVSAKDKKINIQDRVLTVIQTNAAINPGNSGGPLVNMNGEVIGINTAKLAESAGFSSSGYKIEGMGYSITANKAKPIIEELMDRTTKPFLGISGQDITEDISAMYDIPTLGVFVSSVIKGSSAEAAGIVRSDIITSFDGKAIFTMEQLSEYIKQCKVGDKIEVKLLRNGDTQMSLTVTLAQYMNEDF